MRSTYCITMLGSSFVLVKSGLINTKDNVALIASGLNKRVNGSVRIIMKKRLRCFRLKVFTGKEKVGPMLKPSVIYFVNQSRRLVFDHTAEAEQTFVVIYQHLPADRNPVVSKKN